MYSCIFFLTRVSEMRLVCLQKSLGHKERFFPPNFNMKKNHPFSGFVEQPQKCFIYIYIYVYKYIYITLTGGTRIAYIEVIGRVLKHRWKFGLGNRQELTWTLLARNGRTRRAKPVGVVNNKACWLCPTSVAMSGSLAGGRKHFRLDRQEWQSRWKPDQIVTIHLAGFHCFIL